MDLVAPVDGPAHRSLPPDRTGPGTQRVLQARRSVRAMFRRGGRGRSRAAIETDAGVGDEAGPPRTRAMATPTDACETLNGRRYGAMLEGDIERNTFSNTKVSKVMAGKGGLMAHEPGAQEAQGNPSGSPIRQPATFLHAPPAFQLASPRCRFITPSAHGPPPCPPVDALDLAHIEHVRR